MVQNCALSGVFFVVVFGRLWSKIVLFLVLFFVVVFGRLWSKIVLFLVLFLWSCLVDCGPKLCSFWCFFCGRVW